MDERDVIKSAIYHINEAKKVLKTPSAMSPVLTPRQNWNGLTRH